MKKDGKYRFSLQFGADTEPDIRAGEFLEILGNKKSAVVVAALNDYLDRNPELLFRRDNLIIRIEKANMVNRDELEDIIHRIIKEHLACVNSGTHLPVTAENEDTLREDIALMLDNLDLFN